MRKLAIGLAAAVISFATTRKLTAAKARDAKPDIDWISADLAPGYSAGDVVVLVNPYTEESAAEDWDGTPIYYEIDNVDFDEVDQTYRYYMKGDDSGTWYAEEWLVEPMFPVMMKARAEFAENNEEVDVMKKQAGKADKQAVTKYQIDYWLMTLHGAIEEEDEKEEATARAALAELTENNGK